MPIYIIKVGEMCFFQCSFRTEMRSVFCMFLLGQICQQWFELKVSFTSAIYNGGKLSCKLKMKVKAWPQWNSWEFCHWFQSGQCLNQDINLILFCLILNYSGAVLCMKLMIFFWCSAQTEKNKMKIIFSQPKPIVYFAKPTETHNTFFVSRGISLDTKYIVSATQISQSSVFIYYQKQFFKQNQINVFV